VVKAGVSRTSFSKSVLEETASIVTVRLEQVLAAGARPRRAILVDAVEQVCGLLAPPVVRIPHSRTSA
jgi:hypothetical protein